MSKGGSLDTLLPKGCKRLEDCPADLMLAIDHAISVNAWYSNCAEEEMPPRWMWPFDKEIAAWFEEVKLARKNPSSDGDADNEDMVVNEYAKDLR